MRKNNTNKKQNTIIAVLAVLLIGLLTVNLTYAFFTDRKTATQTLTFGEISFELGKNAPAAGRGAIVDIYNNDDVDNTVLMPGSVLKTNFKVTLGAASQNAWVRFKLTAKYDEEAIATELGGVTTFVDGRPESGESAYVVLGTTGYKVSYDGTDYTVNTYSNGTWTGVVSAADAAKVLAYLANLPEGVSYSESTGTVTASGLDASLTQANAELYATKHIALEESITLLNNAITKYSNGITTSVSDTHEDDETGDDVVTYWYVASDGYIYRNAETIASEVVNVNFSYQVPFETSNVLQEHNVIFDLVVEAVQTINTKGDVSGSVVSGDTVNNAAGMDITGIDVSFNIDDDVNLTADTLTIAAAANTGDYANIYYSARAFHAAVKAHGEIVAKY